MSEFNYIRHEFKKPMTGTPARYQLKVSSDAGETRWLTVSAEQVGRIRDMLATDEESEAKQ